jgi:hypothetical protein
VIHFLLAGWPFFCRLVQSLRRWHDSRLGVHLINASILLLRRHKRLADADLIGRKIRKRYTDVRVLLFLEAQRELGGDELRALRCYRHGLLRVCLQLGVCYARVRFRV